LQRFFESNKELPVGGKGHCSWVSGVASCKICTSNMSHESEAIMAKICKAILNRDRNTFLTLQKEKKK
jgi:hypothetical protein